MKLKVYCEDSSLLELCTNYHIEKRKKQTVGLGN